MGASIEKSSGKAYCRGAGCDSLKKVPKNTKCLRVSIYGAGGTATSFYCEKCMKLVLNTFIKSINDANKDVSEL